MIMYSYNTFSTILWQHFSIPPTHIHTHMHGCTHTHTTQTYTTKHTIIMADHAKLIPSCHINDLLNALHLFK